MSFEPEVEEMKSDQKKARSQQRLHKRLFTCFLKLMRGVGGREWL